MSDQNNDNKGTVRIKPARNAKQRHDTLNENILANQRFKHNRQFLKQVMQKIPKNQNKQKTIPLESKDDIGIRPSDIVTYANPKEVSSTSTITPTIADPLSPTVPVPLSSISPTSDSKTHKAIYKIFPSSYPNNRGRYVGKEYIKLLKDSSFMDNFDDVDFYMNALFKNMINDLKDEKSSTTKYEPRSILPYFQKVVNFDPFTHTKKEETTIPLVPPIPPTIPSTIPFKIGGKTKRKNQKSKRNKKQKRRTYKKKK